MSDTFFTSDTHFGHRAMIHLANRPFSSVEEMDEAMIQRWNNIVGKRDDVYHLGDFAFRCSPGHCHDVLRQLNGYIHLIEGNHDQVLLRVQRDHGGLVSVKQYEEVEVKGQRIIMFHYALRTWHWDLSGTWHVYGHTHNLLQPWGKSCDVGVDAWDYRPVSFEELKAKMESLPDKVHPAFAVDAHNITPTEGVP